MQEIEEILDINYLNNNDSNDDKHKLDLYYPKNNQDKERPLIIYVHGGFWVDRDKKEYSNFGRVLAKETNSAVAIINYRLTNKDKNNPIVIYPNHNEDLVNSIIYLIENNQEQYYSNKKIILIGHSCGAHMISIIGLEWDKYIENLKLSESKKLYKSSLIGFIGIQGLYNLKGLYEDFPSYLSDISLPMGCYGDNENNKDLWYDPLLINNTNLNSDDHHATPHWLIIHSPDDTWVNRRQSLDMVNHLKNKLSFKNVKLEENLNGAHFEVVENFGNLSDTTSNKTREIIFNFINLIK